MADYYPLLARALEALPNSSPAMRKAVYDRARNALTAQLRSLDPPVSEADIAIEQKALDTAIERLEAGLAKPEPPAQPPVPVPAADPKPEAVLRPEPPGKPAPAPETIRPATPAPPPPEPPPETVSGQEALPEAAPMPAAVPLNMQSSPATSAPAAGADRAAARPEPAQPQGSKPGETRPEPTKPEEAKPRTEFVAFVPPPRKKATEPAAAASEEGSGAASEAANVSAPATTAPPAQPNESGGSRRPKIDVVAPQASRSRALRNAFVGGVLALVIGAIAVAAFLLRDEPSGLGQDSENDGQHQVEQSEQKFGDRVDGPGVEEDAKRPSTPATPPEVTVAQRGILYEENTSNPQAEPKTTMGRVVWRLEPVNGEQGQPLQNAVRMTADFPEAGMLLTMTIRKNLDATLPASHTVELDFTMSGPSASQVVQEIGLLQLKDDQHARGQTVAGLPVRVRDNLFLIGLSNLPDDITRNRDLLLQRAWIDLGFKFRSGQRGVLAIEKGASGAQVMQSAFDLWRD